MAGGFDPFNVQVRHQPALVTLEGGVPLPASHVPSAEEVLGGGVQFDIKDLPLRDPRYFVSGQLFECIPGWENIIDSEFGNVDVLKWIKHGVDIHEFFIILREISKVNILIVTFRLNGISKMLVAVSNMLSLLLVKKLHQVQLDY